MIIPQISAEKKQKQQTEIPHTNFEISTSLTQSNQWAGNEEPYVLSLLRWAMNKYTACLPKYAKPHPKVLHGNRTVVRTKNFLPNTRVSRAFID